MTVPIEYYANGPVTTVASPGVDDFDTSLVVASDANFPGVGNFHIKVDGEIMLVTNVSGTAPSTWTVSHADLRLRATGAIRHVAGRGTISLRLGLGATLVREVRDFTQGTQAGAPMETTALSALPAADLDLVVTVNVVGPWLFVLAGGPTVDVLDKGLHGGWTAEIGVAWRP